MTAVSPTPSY
jgi:hypothetical protein